MAISEEEANEIRKQLKQQLSHLNPEKRREAEKQIDAMSKETIESMLNQQNANTEIFRMVVSGEIPAVIVEENNESLAVMEIRPLTKGHVLVIPKTQIKEIGKIPKEIIKFAREISKKIKNGLGAKKVLLKKEIKFGEVIIELIPEYNAKIEERKERIQIPREELEKIANEIKKEVIKIKRKVGIKKKINKKNFQEKVVLKRRIP